MHPTEKDKASMLAVPFDLDERARKSTRLLEDREAERLGVTVSRVRKLIAEQEGILPGTLENLRKGRTKGVRGYIFQKLQAALIRQMGHELVAFLHEFQDFGGGDGSITGDEVRAAVAGVERLLAALDRASRPFGSSPLSGGGQ